MRNDTAGKNMQGPHRKFTKRAEAWVAACAVVAAAALAGMSTAFADEAQAKALLKAMSDYLAAQKSFSFDTDTTLEIVTTDHQKLGLASSGTITVTRPDKIHATRTGGFSDVELVSDGKTVTFANKDSKQYAQVDVPGTIDQLIDVLRDKYHRPLPAADLLMSDVYDQLMPLVVDVKDLGVGVIRGIDCDHLAFRTKEVDWQIWIAEGDRPYPCRFVVNSPHVSCSPEYSVDVRNWRTGTEVAADAFSYKAPADFKQVAPNEVTGMDELPAAYRPKTK